MDRNKCLACGYYDQDNPDCEGYCEYWGCAIEKVEECNEG